jgi:agmatine deiminase
MTGGMPPRSPPRCIAPALQTLPEEETMKIASLRPGLAAALSLAIGVPVLSLAHPALADEPIWDGDRLVYPEGSAIPADLTPTEQRFLDLHPLAPLRDATDPPTGPIHCVAEYEPMDGLIIAWEGNSSWKFILEQMAVQITTIGDADVYVIVDSSSEGNEVVTTLDAAGADMDRVQIIIRTTDTIWCRDYGPRYIYEGDCRAIIDHTYNRPRPNDNLLPSYFATVKNHALYEIPLVHGGGNYHLNALDEGNTSRLIVNENPNLTEQEIHDLWMAYQNVDTTFFTPFPTYVDSTQHIDMWMQVIGDRAIVISDWPFNQGSIQDDICEDAVDLFESRGYTVTRVPARSVSGTHYTYTNVVVCNDLVLIPLYTNAQVQQHNAEALAAWQSAMPDSTIVQINCESIVSYAGVMHCIVMHVPEPRGGVNPTAYLKNLRGGEMLDAGDDVEINWISDDDIAVTDVDLLLSTDGGATFDTVIAEGTADDGSYVWNVPGLCSLEARIRVVVHDADGNTGSDESDANLSILGGGANGDLNCDGSVNVFDLLMLLDAWGPCVDCPEDLNGDGTVNVFDLLLLLDSWG